MIINLYYIGDINFPIRHKVALKITLLPKSVIKKRCGNMSTQK